MTWTFENTPQPSFSTYAESWMHVYLAHSIETWLKSPVFQLSTIEGFRPQMSAVTHVE